MFMLKVYRNIIGYVEFSGKGVFPERFLNLCAKENILVFNPRVDVDTISGCMYIKDYKQIRTTARKSCMVLKIKKRNGLPFIINRYKHRYGIVIGAILFFSVLWYLSGFCFNITLSANAPIDKEKTLLALKECGVYIGRRISHIDTEKARQSFLINNPEFAWSAINIKGCFITVELTKTEEKTIKNKIKTPCNIIAKKSGKILKVKAYNGRVAVKLGEAVAKGDLLVSGAVELTNKTTKFVRADAQVIAQTRYKLRVFVPFKNKEKLYSDKPKKRSVLSIANINIPLYLGEIKKPYIVKSKIKDYKISSVVLPIKKTTAYFTEIYYKDIILNKESAKELAKSKMENKAKKLLKNTIKSSNEGEFFVSNDGVEYTKIFICEEDIAQNKKILKN